jgi:DNA-binding MarR family transcriptional regulator
VEDPDLLATATIVRQGANQLARRMRRERGEAALPQQSLSILAHLRRSGPSTPGDLAALEHIQPQSLTRTLSSLERAGLVDRQPHPTDGRSTLLALTEASVRAWRDDMRRRDAWLAAAMSAELTESEQGLLRLAGELMVRLASSPVCS